MNLKSKIYNSVLSAAINRRYKRSVLLSDTNWSVGNVCALLGVPVPKDVNAFGHFSFICTYDSYTEKDCLFILCRGRNAEDALKAAEAGALAVLTEVPLSCPSCILVPDIVEAQITLYRMLYEKNRIPTTVITGSVGKTTATQMVNCVYSTQYRTFYDGITENVFNKLAAQLQHFDKKAERFVVETSEKPMYCTRYFSLTLNPQIAVITTIDKSHLSEFGSEENIYSSVCSVADGMADDGYVIINADDPKSKSLAFRQHIIRVSANDKSADCLAKNIEEYSDSVEFDCVYEHQRTHIKLYAPGMHNVYNAMMALVAGRINGIPYKKIVRGLRKYRAKGYRQRLYRSGNKTIYADCYNASGRSIDSALRVLKSVRTKGKKAAVIGDIAEINGFEESIYHDIANSVDESGIDFLVTFGSSSFLIAENIRSPVICIHCNTYDELFENVKKLKKEGVRAFLFKGSRVMHMEKAIKAAFPLLYRRMVIPEKVRYVIGILRGAVPDEF